MSIMHEMEEAMAREMTENLRTVGSFILGTEAMARFVAEMEAMGSIVTANCPTNAFRGVPVYVVPFMERTKFASLPFDYGKPDPILILLRGRHRTPVQDVARDVARDDRDHTSK